MAFRDSQTDQSIEEVRALIRQGNQSLSLTLIPLDGGNSPPIGGSFRRAQRRGLGRSRQRSSRARPVGAAATPGRQILDFPVFGLLVAGNYPRLFEELQSRSRCLLRNPRLIVFQLEPK